MAPGCQGDSQTLGAWDTGQACPHAWPSPGDRGRTDTKWSKDRAPRKPPGLDDLKSLFRTFYLLYLFLSFSGAWLKFHFLFSSRPVLYCKGKHVPSLCNHPKPLQHGPQGADPAADPGGRPAAEPRALREPDEPQGAPSAFLFTFSLQLFCFVLLLKSLVITTLSSFFFNSQLRKPTSWVAASLIG